MKSITRFTKNIRGNKCLNCENDISEHDNFCAQCGQVNDLKKVSLAQYLSAYFDDFLSFDSRLLNTIVALIFKPGYVTKNYIAGKRMSYVNPFKLYIQITILFFLLIGIFGTIDKFKPVTDTSAGIISELNTEKGRVVLDSIKSETLKELKKNDIPIDSSTLSLLETGIGGISLITDSIQNEINRQSGDRSSHSKDNQVLMFSFVDSITMNPNLIEDFSNESMPKDLKDSLMNDILKSLDKKAAELTKGATDFNIDDWTELDDGWIEISKKGNLKKMGINHLDSVFKAEKIDYEIPLAMIYSVGANQSGLNRIKIFMDYQKDYPNSNAVESLEKLGFKVTYWNTFLFSKSKEWTGAFGDEHYWGELIDRILSRISVALFFLLPIFTLIVTLLYIRRKFNYTENLIFVFHVQTVFFLLLLIFMIVDRIVDSKNGVAIFLLSFLIYLYMAMKNFYEQGWFKTFVKYILLNTAFLFFALIGGIIISFLAFLI